MLDAVVVGAKFGGFQGFRGSGVQGFRSTDVSRMAQFKKIFHL